MSNDQAKIEDQQREELRRRMLRELEEFLSKWLHRPVPRLRLRSAPPIKRYTVSSN